MHQEVAKRDKSIDELKVKMHTGTARQTNT
jgi:hypothetical protein